MIRFVDAPYRFEASRYDPLWSVAIAAWLRAVHLPLRMGVRPVRITGDGGEAGSFGAADRVMVVANHTSLVDGSVLVDVLRRRGLHPCFLSTYQMFLRPGVVRWSLRRLGAMSIQPQGSDLQGMQEALRVLGRGPRRGRMRPSLCVFPEGQIYRDMDRVCGLEDGAFALAVRAAWEMRGEARVHVLPVSIHVSHVDPASARGAVLGRMSEVESLLGVRSREGEGMRRRLVRAGRAYLEGAARGLGVGVERGGLRRGLEGVRREGARVMLEELGDGGRGRACRSEAVDRAVGLFYQRHREGGDSASRRAGWAERLTVLKRLERYDLSHLVGRRLTFNQVAGLVETLVEDLGGCLPRPIGRREVFVAFERPVCVSDGVEGMVPSELVARTRDRVAAAIDARLRGWHEARVSAGDGEWWD